MAETAAPAFTDEKQLGGPSFSDAAQDLAPLIRAREQEWTGASARVAEGLREKSAAVTPKLEAAERASTSIAEEAPRRLAALEAAKPQITPPPSRALTDFLGSVNGQSPERSISAFIQGMGLLATGIGGLAKGDARAALASMTGALKGWQEGDKERADRAFGDWKAKTDAALEKFGLEMTSYREWFDNAKFSTDQMLSGAKITALMHDNKIAADVFAQNNIETALGWMQSQRTHEDQVRLRMAQLINAHEIASERQAELERHNREVEAAAKERIAEQAKRDQQNHELHLAIFEWKQEQAREGAAGPGAFTPDSLEFMAQQYYRTGNLPPMGMGKASTQARAQILNRAAEIAKEAGTSPEDQVARTQLAKATQVELNKLLSQRGVVLAFARTAERNLAIAEELSEKVDRTGAPVFNKWLLAGRRGIAGDVDVTNLDAAVRTVINEYAKVTSGTSAGSDTARREVESMLNATMTKEQFRGVAKVLRREMASRERGYDDQIKAAQDAVKGLSGTSEPAKPSGTDRVTVRFKRDVGQYKKGSTGKIDRKDMDPDLFEIVEK